MEGMKKEREGRMANRGGDYSLIPWFLSFSLFFGLPLVPLGLQFGAQFNFAYIPLRFLLGIHPNVHQGLLDF